MLAGFVGVFEEEEGVLEVVGWRAWVWVEFVVDVDVQVVGEEETKEVDEKTGYILQLVSVAVQFSADCLQSSATYRCERSGSRAA